MNDTATAVEAVEEDHETTAAVEIIEPPQSGDQMDAVIAISKRIEDYARAHDMIVGAVVKRSYPGDWVVHKKDSDKDDDQKANMGAAAAERMAAFVGINESNWTAGVKEWSDDKKHYTWTYEADFTFGKRTIHVISRVGTRDKFFGKVSGGWKPLEDVQEDDIKKAAFRACRKEGVRTLLGLRNVPVIKLKELGFDVTKVNFVGFENKGKTLGADQKQVNAASGLIERTILVKEMKKTEGTSKSTGRPWIRWDVVDKEGVKYAMFVGQNGSKRADLLSDAYGEALPIKIEFQVNKTAQGESYQIVKVTGEVDA